MSSNRQGTRDGSSSGPSMLDLVRLSPRLLFLPGGVDLYRQIALLTGMAEGGEVLDVACGRGVPLEHFVREYGVHGSGVDPDPRLIEAAEARCREGGIGARVNFQTAECDSLPYRDEVFDISIGEFALAARCDPRAAVRELVRVTKPGGTVVLVQLAWRVPVDAARQRLLTGHLGVRPLLLVEWKRLLHDTGVEGLYMEEWSGEETSLRPRAVKPFPDFAEIFSVSEKVRILRRAWARWGWLGVRALLSREREIHALLTRERVLRLDLLKGRRAPAKTERSLPEPDAVPARGLPGAVP